MENSIQEKLAPLIEEAGERWNSLPEDARQRIKTVGIVAAVVLPLLIVFLPLLGARLKAQRSLESSQAQVEELLALEKILIENDLITKDKGKKPKSRNPKANSLLGMLDKITTNLGVGNLVQSMRPSKSGKKGSKEESVDIQLTGLVLEELMRLIHAIENSNSSAYIRRLEVQKEIKDEQFLRASLEVVR